MILWEVYFDLGQYLTNHFCLLLVWTDALILCFVISLIWIEFNKELFMLFSSLFISYFCFKMCLNCHNFSKLKFLDIYFDISNGYFWIYDVAYLFTVEMSFCFHQIYFYILIISFDFRGVALLYHFYFWEFQKGICLLKSDNIGLYLFIEESISTWSVNYDWRIESKCWLYCWVYK